MLAMVSLRFILRSSLCPSVLLICLFPIRAMSIAELSCNGAGLRTAADVLF